MNDSGIYLLEYRDENCPEVLIYPDNDVAIYETCLSLNVAYALYRVGTFDASKRKFYLYDNPKLIYWDNPCPVDCSYKGFFKEHKDALSSL